MQTQIGRRFPFWTVVLLSLAFVPRAGAEGPHAFAFLSDSAGISLEQNLQRHVDSAKLRAWRDTCGAEERVAFDYLFAWLPPADLGSWRADQVLDDIALALRTRREAPWAGHITDALFLPYVLPHRVAQEPIQSWRRPLHDALAPRVRGMDLRQAALEANRFCREWATFIPTSSRDQGPLTTMARGLGRCEEEQIFYICAARSVGVPARPCFTPWWTASDNNHAWVEVFTGDGWHYLGACEPEADLDAAWFTGPARRAGLVLSIAYGQALALQERVHSQKAGATWINSTGVYARPGTARVEWADRTRGREPSPSTTARTDVPVFVHVFNSGALSVLGEFPAGDTIPLGPGGYVATCQVDGNPLAAFFEIRSGESTVIRFDPDANEAERWSALENPFWLRVPVPEEPAGGTAGNATVVDSIVQRAHLASLAENEARRRSHSTLDSLALRGMLGAMGGDAAQDEAIEEQLALAGPEAPGWISLLSAIGPDPALRSAVRSLILQMDDKDFLEARPEEARAALAEAVRVRQSLAAPVPDSLWNDFVLSPRIDFQPCDFGLWSELPRFEGARPDSIHEAFTSRVREARQIRFGHLARPTETWRSGWATPSAARVALVGLMRRNGVPARIEPSRRWVEVFSDGEWIPVDPLDPDSWNRREGEVDRAYVEPATLDAVFSDLGAPMTRAEGWVHFRLARFDKGRFDSPLIDYPVQDGRLALPLEPGEWWLFGGQRNHDGNARVVAHRFLAESGRPVHVDMELGIPPAEREAEDLAPRQLSKEVLAACGIGAEGSYGEPEFLALPGEYGPRGTLLFVWADDCEPCSRTAEALSKARETCRASGLELLSVRVAALSLPGRDLYPEADRGLSITPEEMVSLFGIDSDTRLPLLAITDSEGRTKLLVEGMQLAAGDLIRQAAAN